MSKYKTGDKVVLTIIDKDEKGNYPIYVLNDNFYISVQGIDEYTEPLTTYTEPLKAKIKSLAEEITRLLAENERLKKDLEYYHTGTDICDIESARITGQNEAWELARKIVLNNGYSNYDLYKIFNCCGLRQALKDFTYQEAATKVEEWENTKKEIKRGDIIRNKYNASSKFCVTDIGCDGHLYGVGRYGLIYSNQDPEYWEKTGRHIDIDSFLKQIGGAE